MLFFAADCVVLDGDFNCYESDNDKLSGNVVLAEYLSRFCSAFAFVEITLPFQVFYMV